MKWFLSSISFCISTLSYGQINQHDLNILINDVQQLSLKPIDSFQFFHRQEAPLYIKQLEKIKKELLQTLNNQETKSQLIKLYKQLVLKLGITYEIINDVNYLTKSGVQKSEEE
ncbi:MAG: hypothetical protein WA432_01520 [Candidatus Babeliaceae bacterium]